MPRLPSVDDLGARPTPQSNRQLAVVGNAGAVAEAAGGAGRALTEVGTKLEEMHNEDDARRLDIQHAEGARAIRREAQQAQGMNAAAARTLAETKMQALNQSVLTQARSHTVRNALEPMISRRSAVEMDGIDDHALRQTTAAMGAAMDARRDIALTEAEENWNNPAAVEASLQTALSEIYNRGQWHGEADEQIRAEQLAARSRVRTAVAQQMLTAGDRDGAAAYVDEHSAEMDHRDETALRATIRDLWLPEEGDRVADEAVAGATATPAPTAPHSAPENEGNQPERFRVGSFTVGDGYGARRGSGGTHLGVDMSAPTGTPFPVGRDFNVVESHRQQRVRDGRDGGNIARVRFDDGSEWLAMHLPDLPRAGRYAAGSAVIRSGDSGSATAENPHVHWQPANEAARAIYNQGRHATAAYLTGSTATAAGGGPAVPTGVVVDYTAARQRLRDMNLAPDVRRAALASLDRRVAAEDRVIAREGDAVADEISQRLITIQAGGGRLTDINQIDPGLLARARRWRPQLVAQLQDQAYANNHRQPDANSALALTLGTEAAMNPNAFLARPEVRNPELLRGRITDGEVGQITQMRDTILNRHGPQPSELLAQIRFVLPTTDMLPQPDPHLTGARLREATQERAARQRDIEGRLLSAVQQRLARTMGHAEITQEDVLRAVRAEVTMVHVGGRAVHVFEAREQGARAWGVPIPPRAIPTIDAMLQRAGLPVNGTNRAELYLQNREELDRAAARAGAP